jgi:uncharacterized protein
MAPLAGGPLAPFAALRTQAPAAPVVPSVDCAGAVSAVEQLICHDTDLARLDRKMDAVDAASKKLGSSVPGAPPNRATAS